MKYYKSPVNKGWVNFAGHPNGDALDIGWRLGHSQNQDLFPIWSGKVLQVGYLNDTGNNIVISHPWDSKYDCWASYSHLQHESKLKVGSNLTLDTKIGNMGNTGNSNGSHLHLRMSLVPKGSKFSWSTYNSYKRLNPAKYIYEYPNQDVLDLQKLPKNANNNDLDFYAEDGNITITAKNGSNIRQEPSINSKRVGGLAKGTKINYTGYTDNDGYRWVKTAKGWVANRTLKEPIEYFAKAEFNKPQNNPKPKPKPTKVGKYANFGGWVRLFRKAVGDECYHETKNGQKNVKTDVRNTSAKVLKEENGRVLVDVPRFNPSKVWIANSESTISDKPEYKL